MTQTRVTLGDITFAGLEVPERIAFGGEQSLAVHELVGGVRVVDAMGRQDMPLEWSGYFMGPTALARALYLNTQRVIGQALVLTWSQLRFLVVIQHYEAHYELSNHIPYKITCTVIADQATPTVAGVVPDIDDQMSGDFNTANAFGVSIGDGALTGLLGTLGTGITAVSTFANAAQSTINGVLQPIAAVQARVGTLLASAVNATQSVTTVGGLIPNSPLAQSVAALAGQVTSFGSQSSLFGLQNVMGRMTANLGAVSGNAKIIPVAGGNLFAIAAQQYGDATSWTGIAKASGLTDPVINGLQQIVVPTKPDTVGGVLGH
jgi:hypothetical protein